MDDCARAELERQRLEWRVRLAERLRAGDWDCAIRAVEQVVGRLKQLAGRDADIDRAFNIALLWQQHRHQALDISDVTVTLDRMYDWASRLGAPADERPAPAYDGRPAYEVVPERVLDVHCLIDLAVLRCHAATGRPTDQLIDELVSGL